MHAVVSLPAPPAAQPELSPPPFCHTLPCPCCCARCDHSGKLCTALPHAFWSPDGLLSLLWFARWTNCSPVALKAACCASVPDCARSLATVARSAVVSRRSLLACAVSLTASALRVPLTRPAEGTCRRRGNSGTGSERKSRRTAPGETVYVLPNPHYRRQPGGDPRTA